MRIGYNNATELGPRQVEPYMKLKQSFLIACLVLPGTVWAAEAAHTATADQAAVVYGNNAFAVDLYGRLRMQDGNLFFSPESISTALAMTYAGASGSTASEMARTLHFTLPQDRLHPAMGALLGDLNAPHNGYQLRVADALWAQKGNTFLGDFLQLMKNDYGAGFNQVDFKDATEAVRLTINKWVEEKTDDKITNMLQPGVLTSQTRLVLTNAIYFKGTWQTQFDKALTKDEDFHLSPANTIKAPLMHREGPFKYFNGGTFQALDLPYKSDELSMIVILPTDAGGLPALEQSLTASNTELWLSELAAVPNVILTMAKFNMTQQFGLNGALSALGMPQAFETNLANFSGMDGKRDFVMSAVIHKAYIDVDEQGTEAAAATTVVIRRRLAIRSIRLQPPVFRADHPFLFLIRDNRSGCILFMGRVTDPTNEN
jgi:serpin B